MNSPAITVRPAGRDDAAALQAIFNAVIAEGNAFLSEQPKSVAETSRIWLEKPAQAFVACDAATGEIAGACVYYPNAQGRGAHVANAIFMVAPGRRGQGIGYLLGAHALAAAGEAGYRAMQFNAVVSTNTAAVSLWERLGFVHVGTVPGGYRLGDGEYVDTYIMHRSLEDIA